ncbi:unnamed protein product [Thlaspi arvense]|uniref:Uncharacterized protein n=1 Tax=Thlaspi arvense TaxID=13288 RepID=A0AAU9RZ01_THLAR|nr:unnamed protein product [Thlaspi arvense]
MNGEIHREFIATPTHLKEQLQEEFCTAKCCSLKKKNWAKHFKRQTRRYYALNGLNDPSLKKLYIRDQGKQLKISLLAKLNITSSEHLTSFASKRSFGWNSWTNQSISKICARPDQSIKCSKSKTASSCDPRIKPQGLEDHFKGASTKSDANDSSEENRALRKQQEEAISHKLDISIAPDIDLDNHDLETVLSYDTDDKDAICGYSNSDNSSESSYREDEEECCFQITQMPRQDKIQTPHLQSQSLTQHEEKTQFMPLRL